MNVDDHHCGDVVMSRPVLASVPMGRITALVQVLVVFSLWSSPLLVDICLDIFTSTESIPLEERGGWIYIGVIIHGLLAIMLVSLVLLRSGQSWRTLGFRRFSVGKDFLFAFGGLVSIYLLQIILITAVTLMSQKGVISSEALSKDAGQRVEALTSLPWIGPLGILAFCIFVGFYEEFLFRGFMLTRLAALFGNWTVAVLFSSTVFAVAHLYEGRLAVVQIFIVSVVLSVLFKKRGLLAPVLVHIAFNAVAFVAVRMIEKLGPLEREFQKLFEAAG